MFRTSKRMPSTGHQWFRSSDEKHAKRPHFDPPLSGGGFRGGGPRPEEERVLAPLELRSSLLRTKGLQKGYTPDPDHLYINATVPGAALTASASTTVDPSSAIAANFDQTFASILIQKPSDYKLAVVRFSVPISSVPLFYYPVGSCSVGASITNLSGTFTFGPATSTNPVAASTVTVSSADPGSDIAAGAVPGYPNGAIAVFTVQQFLDGVNNAISAVCLALATSGNAWNGNIPGLQSANPISPYISFDPTTNLCAISFETNAWFPQQAQAASPNFPANLFFNYTLYQTYFPTFEALYRQANTGVVGNDVQILLRQSGPYPSPASTGAINITNSGGSYVVVNAPPSTGTILGNATGGSPFIGVAVGDMVAISGVTTATGGGAAVVQLYNGIFKVTSLSVVAGANGQPPQIVGFTTDAGTLPTSTLTGTTGGITITRLGRAFQVPGQMSVMVQETPTVGSWLSMATLRLVTQSVPVRPELVPTQTLNPASTKVSLGPLGGGFVPVLTLGNGAIPTGVTTLVPASITPTSQVNTQQIMIDFSPDIANTLVLRDYLTYTSHEMYRWIDLIGDNPMQRFDVAAQWVDRFGNAFPLTVAPTEVFDIKFLLQHKYAGM